MFEEREEFDGAPSPDSDPVARFMREENIPIPSGTVADSFVYQFFSARLVESSHVPALTLVRAA